MHVSAVLLHLAGAIMLLLFAVQMLRGGVESAYGGRLKAVMGTARGSRTRAAAAGTLLAILMQSSTAVIMLACGFATAGLVTPVGGLAVALGADLGSALVARLLSFDLSWLMPVCLAVGGVMHLKMRRERAREIGRIVLGVGFVLLSLQLIGSATAPLRDAQLLPRISAYLAEDYITAVLIAAGFTWLIHSSVAAILMVAAFAAQGVLAPGAILPIVLGVNIGAGLIAFWLTRGSGAAAQRIAAGNLALRSIAALATVVAFETLGPATLDLGLGAGPGASVVNLHVLFNLALMVVGLVLIDPVVRLTAALLPDPAVDADGDDLLGHRVSVLDRAVIGKPRLALTSATREILRMGELVEIMIRPLMQVLQSGNTAEIARIRAIDHEVNRAHTNIKLYLAEVNRGEMTGDDARRSIELTEFAINLEHAGDIIAKTLLTLADEKAESGVRFSDEGWVELADLHRRLLENFHLSLNVLLSQDQPSARQLVKEKERMRQLARETLDNHLRRLQAGTPESIQTSGLHLEIARGLKEMNSLITTVAYPLLDRSGELLDSRLTEKS